MTDTDDIADRQRQIQLTEWDLAAPGWVRYEHQFVEPSEPALRLMLDMAAPRPGERALDLACGVGNPAFALAEAVRPGGSVLGLDISPGMIDGARQLAASRGIREAEFQVIVDETSLPVPTGAFDLATCKGGMQYMPDPIGAARAVYRALRPGGRFVVKTLGAVEKCLPIQIQDRALSRGLRRQSTVPGPESGIPGPVSLNTAEVLTKVLTEAGFTEVTVQALQCACVTAEDAAQYWEIFESTAASFTRLLTTLSEQERATLRREAVADLSTAFPAGPVSVSAEFLFASGCKA